jgi:hydrogenase nickel incorporation protein HypA/HybF
MHEMSLFKDILKKIESISRDNEGKKIVNISVKIGALSHLSASHFLDHFSTFSIGTAAEGADVDIVVDENENDPYAQEVILQSVEVEI